VNLRDLLSRTTGVETTTDSQTATVIQSRHRIPEVPLRRDQLLVLQVPLPEPLRIVEPSEVETRRMHAESDYSRMWVYLYEDIVRNGAISFGAGYPVRVGDHYVMTPSPIPKWDIKHLNDAEHLTVLSAGREKRVFAVPPHTTVEPLEFDDIRFHVESFDGASCRLCGATDTFLNEVFDEATGERYHLCSDTGHCAERAKGGFVNE
jgi:alpha-D-ribose 1-methylphosphonate 5-phosphate C-P lyase